MPAEITLTIPDDILAQAEADAAYYRKSIQDILVDALRQVYPAVDPDSRHAQMEREVEAFQTLHPQLATTHLGEWVAIHGGQVVDHDADLDALIDRVRDRFGNDAVVMLDQVLPTITREIRLRSPRFVSEP